MNCPSGHGVVATGYRTQDIDLNSPCEPRAFRCRCGQVHAWDSSIAWAEKGLTESAMRAYGLRPPSWLGRT